MTNEPTEDRLQRFHDTYYVGRVDLGAEGTDLNEVINGFYALLEQDTQTPTTSVPEVVMPPVEEVEDGMDADFQATDNIITERHRMRSLLFGHNILKYTQPPQVIDYVRANNAQRQAKAAANPSAEVVPISQAHEIRARRSHAPRSKLRRTQ